jgi:hypothetical protein
MNAAAWIILFGLAMALLQNAVDRSYLKDARLEIAQLQKGCGK